jgi:hypothetical protein
MRQIVVTKHPEAAFPGRDSAGIAVFNQTGHLARTPHAQFAS